MSKFKSRLAPLLDKFVTYRDAIGQWNSSYDYILKRFDRYCLEHHSDTDQITQEIVDGWSSKYETDSQNSHYRRLFLICSFLRYLSDRNLPSALLPEVPHYVKNVPAPHPLTDGALRMFFAVCDSEDFYRNIRPPKIRAISRITIPVFMRFQYSTGMRPVATIHLHRKDVDLKTGVVNVTEDKGHNQHYIVLHDSMLQLMQRYDQEIESMQPDRTYFFESPNGGTYSKCWSSTIFHKLWARANGLDSGVHLYDLRHNYATQNMLRIKGDTDMLDQLTYLSMSMGHSSINSTLRYADLTPQLADKIREISGETFNRIVPEVNSEVE